MKRENNVNYIWKRKKYLFVLTLFLVLIFFSLNSVSAFSGTGNGTLISPYLINNCTQLQEMNNNLTASYNLTKNINCYNSRSWNNGQGFVPIGYDTLHNFSGTFDGRNYIILNLYENLNDSYQYAGMFGYTVDAQIRNVNLKNVNISSSSLTGITGGLIGLAGTTANIEVSNIENISVTGNVKGVENVGGIIGYQSGGAFFVYLIKSYSSANVNGVEIVGGLVGYIHNAYVVTSYSTGNVNGEEDNVGGLVGYNYNSNIYYSYSTGNVKGVNYVGGLFGTCFACNGENNYATGNVTGSDIVGGLIGYSSNSNIGKMYSAGKVNGSSNIGGFIGYDDSGNYYENYWDINTSNQSSSLGATGLNTTQMKNITTYGNWNIANIINFTTEIWFIDDGNDYPRLSYQYRSFLIPAGTGGAILDFVFNYGKNDMPSWVRILLSIIFVIAFATWFKLYSVKQK